MQKTAYGSLFPPVASTVRQRWGCPLPAQITRVMRMLTVLLFAACLSAHAAGTAQSVNLSGKDLTLKQVFSAIQKQTGFFVFGNSDLLKSGKTISLSVTDMPLRNFLDAVLKDQPFTYVIKDKTISLSRKLTIVPGASVGVASLVPPDDLTPVKIKVIDSAGKPLPNVSIILTRKMDAGTSTTTGGTDGDGIITLYAAEGDLLVVSFIGMGAQTIPITASIIRRAGLTVVLSSIYSKLDEVVISVNTGYQRIRPEQSTGAVSQITTREFESQVSTDFLSGLNGKLPGLMINNDIRFTSTVNGTPSSNSLFNIRGISTITGNQSPLIVIDGFPTELSLNMIDPNEIKSVTILKDAAAATVYGVRASNGVIVIERKKAVSGQPKVNFRATAGFTPKENYTRYRWAADGAAINVLYDQDVNSTSVDADTWSRLSTSNESTANTPAYYIMAQQAASVITPGEANQAFNTLKAYNNAADYGDLFQRTASVQTYHLDVSGGSKSALYYFTANYTGNRLQQINNDNKRIILSGRTTFQLSDRLSAELMTDYQENRANAAPVPDINSIYPYERLQDANGNPLPIITGSTINPFYNDVLVKAGLEDYLYYPLADANEVNDRTRGTNNRTTLNLNYKVVRGITFTIGGIYESASTGIRHYASEKSSEARQYIDSYVTGSVGSLVFNVPKGGFLQTQDVKTNSYTARTQLNYDKIIGQHHSINGILGGEIRNVTEQSGTAAYFGYNDQTLLQQPIDYQGIASYSIIGNFISRRTISYANLFNQLYTENRFVSAYSNIVYAFRNRYSLTGSIRIDQSNLFGTDPKYRYKPLWSVGAAWNISNESFLEGNSWIKQLKLRAAYGFNGNVAKLSLPQVIAQSYVNTYTSPYSDALRVYSYANSGLRWEQTKNINIGLDYALFKNISGSIDVYRKNSTDLLASAQIDPTIGASPSYINNASINNKGIEVTLRSDWISKPKLNWNTGFVLSYNTSKVLKIYQNLTMWPSSTNTAGYVEGQPVGALYAYRWAGLNDNGMPRVRDEKGNVTDATDYDNTSAAFYYNGTSIPTINIGLSNRLDIGNFYFYCMVSYYGGFKVQVPRPNASAYRPLEGAGNYWKQPGDEKNTDQMTLSGFQEYFPRMVYENADTYMVKGDYITIRDITASYSFNNSRFLKRIGVNHFEVKLQASNVWTAGFNKYNYSMATGNYAKRYITPAYTMALFTNF
jgi:TonB-linked SusC/RagA family outer membrane protein